MKPKLRIFIAILGLILSIVGIVMLNNSLKAGKVDYISISLFLGGATLAFRAMNNTRHRSRKFKLPEDDSEFE